MNLRVQRNLIVFLVFPSGLIVFGLLGFIHWVFLLFAITHLLIVGKIASRIVCPNCGTQLGMHKHKWGNTVFYIYTPFTKKNCDKCGYKFLIHLVA